MASTGCWELTVPMYWHSAAHRERAFLYIYLIAFLLRNENSGVEETRPPAIDPQRRSAHAQIAGAASRHSLAGR